MDPVTCGSRMTPEQVRGRLKGGEGRGVELSFNVILD